MPLGRNKGTRGHFSFAHHILVGARHGGVLATVLTAPDGLFGFNEAGAGSEPFGQGTLLNNGDLFNVYI